MRISDWSSDVCSSDLISRMARSNRSFSLSDDIFATLFAFKIAKISSNHPIRKSSWVRSTFNLGIGCCNPEEDCMATDHPVPFARFAPAIRPIDLGRAAISAAARVPEPVCVPLLLSEASLPAEPTRAAAATARSLIEQLRTKKGTEEHTSELT